MPTNPLVGVIDAEQEVEAMKKAEYTEDYGEEYDAVVSSVVKFGLFVELLRLKRLIHITT